MTLDLVVAVDPEGTYHVARTLSKPAHHRRGRTVPGTVTVTGFCVRTTEPTVALTPPDHHVDLADRGEASAWCPECAGYLDHLEMAATAEASGTVVPIMSPLQQQIADMRERFTAENEAELARLGEAMTGQSFDDELAAKRELRRLAAEGSLDG